MSPLLARSSCDLFGHAEVRSLCAQEHREEKIIVYFLTCAAVDFYALALPIAAGKDGVQASALHGKMKQSQREATLAAFTSKSGGANALHAKGIGKQVRPMATK